MKRILLVKMSSMGDILHTLPALTDAVRHDPTITFDWVVEESFQEIPRWHSAVQQVIPIALRRWRKNPWQALKKGEPQHCLKQLRQERYDLIIDAQGLLKSVLITQLAKGKTHGLDRHSARESISAWFYRHHYTVEWQQHAVQRARELFAKILNYPLPQNLPEYGIRSHFTHISPTIPRYLVFLHNTTWNSKLWPERYWIALGTLANQKGFHVKLTSGNTAEKARADRIASALTHAEALPRLSIHQVAELLMGATGVVSVDTGFGHLAAALAIPNVALFGPTDAKLTAAYGQNQVSLQTQFSCSPCLLRECNHPDRNQLIAPPCFATSLPPERAWEALQNMINPPR